MKNLLKKTTGKPINGLYAFRLVFYIFLTINRVKKTKFYQKLKECYKGVIPWELSLRGNPTDKVLGLVTKTKFYLKIMKFVANFEKFVLGSYGPSLEGYSKNIDLGLENPYLTIP